MDLPTLMQEARALQALVDKERARVTRSLTLVRTLDAGALLLLSENRHQALQEIDHAAILLAHHLQDAPMPRPAALAQVLAQLRQGVGALRQENQTLVPLLQQALSLLTAYRSALPGAPSVYNRRGQRPAHEQTHGRHSSRA